MRSIATFIAKVKKILIWKFQRTDSLLNCFFEQTSCRVKAIKYYKSFCKSSFSRTWQIDMIELLSFLFIGYRYQFKKKNQTQLLVPGSNLFWNVNCQWNYISKIKWSLLSTDNFNSNNCVCIKVLTQEEFKVLSDLHFTHLAAFNLNKLFLGYLWNFQLHSPTN